MAFSVIRNCPACGKPNRIPARHLADTGRCGSCKATLPPLNEPLEVDDSSFGQVVAEATVPVLTDFWAEWCGPCRMAAPEVKELAKEMAGKALILKVNTEENPQVAARFGVQSIPNFVVLRDGQAVFQQAGLVPRAQMRQWLEAARTNA
jgi:thioredoxin 2